MEIDEEYIDKVKSLIEQKDAENVKTLLTDLHPADIAELCNDLGLEEARFVYRLLDNETAADVLVEMDEDIRKEFLELLPSETIAKRFVDYMDTDDAVDLMRELDEDKQEEVLSHIEDIEHERLQDQAPDQHPFFRLRRRSAPDPHQQAEPGGLPGVLGTGRAAGGHPGESAHPQADPEPRPAHEGQEQAEVE